MIRLIEQNRAQGYLDITWPAIQKLMLSSLTILYGLWEKREKAGSNDVRLVKETMKTCMSNLHELGGRLSSAKRLGQTIKVLADATFRSMAPSQLHQRIASPPSHISPRVAPHDVSLQQYYTQQYIPTTPPNPTTPLQGASPLFVTPNDTDNIWWNVNWNEYMRNIAPPLTNIGPRLFDDVNDNTLFSGESEISSTSNPQEWGYEMV